MAESASGQDEATTRGGKKGPSCPLYMDFRVDPAKKKSSPFDHTINILSTNKLVRSRWLDIFLVLILRFLSKRQKKNLADAPHA